MGSLKLIFTLAVCFVSCSLLLFVMYIEHLFVSKSLLPEPISPRRGYLVDTPGCKMPKWNPMDPSIVDLISLNERPYSCSGKASFLIVDRNATIRMNKSILERLYQKTPESIRCRYTEIIRGPGEINRPTDFRVIYSPVRNVTFDRPSGVEFAHVHCSQEGKDFHEEFLALTPLKPVVEKRCTEAQQRHSKSHSSSSIAPEKLNVIILGIDSVSKLNFIRHFPRTRKFLKKVKAVELHGYNKVADNTFPNLVPLLTGQFISYYWNESKNYMFFDDLDFVWKEFADKGHRTLFAEDDPKLATFNYLKNGFKIPPTDYYIRPFSLAVEYSSLTWFSKENCFGDRMELKVIFDYVKSFVDTMDEQPFFSFSFAKRLTHNVLNNAGKADYPSFEILSYLHSRNVTNNSLVIFMSDHGIRIGPIREKHIGKFEERLPFMFLLFPDWFYRKYPDVERNLRINQNRLTSPFDIHATLKDLLNFTGSTRPKVSLANRGLSLFDEVPAARTCEDAAILPHWCTCQVLTPIQTNSPEVQAAAMTLVGALNDILSNYRDQCANLTLEQVRGALVGQTTDEVPRANEPTNYLITIKVKPSGAVFEGSVRVNNAFHVREVLGDVSRINLYGHQGDCLDDAYLRKFCYCK